MNDKVTERMNSGEKNKQKKTKTKHTTLRIPQIAAARTIFTARLAFLFSQKVVLPILQRSIIVYGF